MSALLQPPLPLSFHYHRPPRAVLGTICFGESLQTMDQHSTEQSSLCIETGLIPLLGLHPTYEFAAAHGPAEYCVSGGVRYASDGEYLLAALELREDQYDSLEHCADQAYQQLQAFNARSNYPHVLRVWNYLDDINLGDGDNERYRRFCIGRARCLERDGASFPAASALGRIHANGYLQVYWLAARYPGQTLENPRQVSAFRYPRDYGPASPSFARACLTHGPLLISGTASIVGHLSQHVGDVQAQLAEILNNLQALIEHARQFRPHMPKHLDAGSLLKVYVRHAEHAPLIAQTLQQHCPDAQVLLLGAEICRRELLLEIDCVHGLVST